VGWSCSRGAEPPLATLADPSGIAARAGTLPRMARRRLRARVNWAMRWGAPVLVALSVAAYPLTHRGYHIIYGGFAPCYYISLHQGAIAIGYTSLPGVRFEPGWSVQHGSQRHPWRYAAWPHLRTQDFLFQGRDTSLWLPLWIPALIALALTFAAWRSHGRTNRGASLCPSCNYDLSGLPPGSPCPECAGNPHPSAP
jgi:hypothetical protein